MLDVKMILGPNLSQVMHKTCFTLAQEVAKSEKPSPFVNKETRVSQLEAQAEKFFEKLSNEFLDAGQILEATLKKISPHNHEKVVKELQKLQSDISTSNFEAFQGQIHTQKSFNSRTLFKISEDSIEALSQAAIRLMEDKLFADAVKAFVLVCIIEPNIYRNWICLGHSAFHSKQYDGAIMAYYMASSLSPTTPWPLIWAANACEMNHEIEEALDLLDRAKVLARESEDKEICALAHDIKEKIALLTVKKRGV